MTTWIHETRANTAERRERSPGIGLAFTPGQEMQMYQPDTPAKPIGGTLLKVALVHLSWQAAALGLMTLL